MVLETVDSCDGWEVKQRIKLNFLRNDGEEFKTDSNFTSYETKDGLGAALQRAQRPERRGRGGAARPGRPRGAGRQGPGELHPAGGAQLRAAGGHAVPDHPSRAHHPARARRRQIGLLQGVRRRPARRRLPGQCGDRQAANRTTGAPPVRGDVGLLRNQPSWSVRLAFFAAGDQGAPSRSTSWRSICWATASPARCCSTTVTSPSMPVLIQLQALPRPKC